MTRPPCTVPGCGRPHRARGYCAPHYVRVTRHGHPQADLPVEAKALGGVGYWACHERVKARRGPAASHRCAECGTPAVEWSYDGTDPAERTDPARGYRYSLDPARYRARCRSCHRRATVAHHSPGPASRLVDVERVVRLYQAGASGRGIAGLLGISHTAVYDALHAHGVAIRTRGTRGLDPRTLPRDPDDPTETNQ